MGESLSEYLILQRFSEFFLSVKIQTTSVFQPVYHGQLTNGPLSVCAFLCTHLVQFPPNSFLLLYFFHVTLLLCCTFFILCSFHDSLFPMYSCKLHYFRVEIFAAAFFYCSIFFMLHFFSITLLLFLAILFTTCDFFVLHFFHMSLFYVTPFLFYTFFILDSVRVALFSLRTLFIFCYFHAAIFSCCTFFIMHFFRVIIFSCCSVYVLHYCYDASFFRRKLRSNWIFVKICVTSKFYEIIYYQIAPFAIYLNTQMECFCFGSML